MSRFAFTVCSVLYLAAAFLFVPLTERMDDQEHNGQFHFMNSDIQYVPSLVKDIQTGADLLGWNIPPANYFFPDALVFAAALNAFPPPMSAQVSGLLLFSLNVLALILFLRVIRRSFVDAPYALAAAALILFALPAGLLPAAFFSLAAPTFHSSAIAGLFFFLALLAAENIRPIIRTTVLPLIVFLWGASDALFLGLAGGAFTVYVLLQVRSRELSRQDLLIAIVCVLAAVLARKSMDWMPMHVVRVSPEADVLQFLKTRFEAAELWVDLKQPWYLTSLLVSAWLLLRSLNTKQIFARFLALPAGAVVVCVLSASFFSRQVGLPVIVDRYAAYAVFFLIIPMTLSARMLVARVCLMLAVFLAAAVGFRTLDKPPVLSPIVERARCLDALSSELRIKNGLGDYWTSKMMTAYSSVRITQVDATVGPRVWISNVNWYLKTDGSIQSYSFVIPRGLHEADVLRRFGPPKLTRICAGAPVWIYATDGSEPLVPFTAEQLAAWRVATGH